MLSATKHAQIAKKLPSWIYKPAAQAYIDKQFPRHLFIELTAACNLTCSYCPREKIKNHMDFGLFTKIIDEASSYGARSFSLHLFGEGLLYPKIIEAIKYIKSKNSNHAVLFTTNGTLLPRYFERLVESGVDKVLWSWRDEVRWSDEFKEKLKNWKAFTVRIIEEVTPEDKKEEFLKWPRVEKRRLHSYGGKISLEKYGVKSMAGLRHACYHLWYAPAVAWNGKFLMCCADPEQKEVFGDLTKETVAVAWQRLERVRQSHLSGKYEGICKNCTVWKEYPNTFFGHEYPDKTTQEISS